MLLAADLTPEDHGPDFDDSDDEGGEKEPRAEQGEQGQEEESPAQQVPTRKVRSSAISVYVVLVRVDLCVALLLLKSFS